MKISRRGFISLGLGASAGLTLSPLPWKLLDDVSIWTQNWPWVPVPEDGRVSYADSVCTLCPGNCGITVRKVGERIVSVAGKADEFTSGLGGICPLGLSAPQLLYTPIRVMSPMLRKKGGFQSIPWEEALSVLAAKLQELRDAGRQNRLALFTDPGINITNMLFKRFLNAFGSERAYHIASADDSWEAVTGTLTGSRLVPGYDLDTADVILSLGCGFAEGWGNPVRSMAVTGHWKETGASLLQIEPRLSSTAALADQWIACNPGFEADLAFGICLAMLERTPSCSQRLLDRVANPAETLKLLNSRYSLRQVEAATGIAGSVIVSLADRFAGANRPLAVCGKGDGKTAVDAREITATLLLNMAVGSMNQKGGLHLFKRQDYTGLSGAGAPGFGFLAENRFQAALEDDGTPVEVLLVAGANPCYTLKNSQSVNEAIEKIPFVVSLASHWDETTMKADLVLPMHSHLEGIRDTAVYGGSADPSLALARPVSKQLFDTRYPVDVLIDISRRLGATATRSFPWKTYEECFKALLGDRLQASGGNGHIDLHHASVAVLPELNVAGVTEEPLHLAGDKVEYPLTLIPKTSMRLSSGAVGSSPFMVKTVPESVLTSKLGTIDINPLSAENQGLSEGDTVLLQTLQGQATVLVHLDEGTMPGLLVLTAGLGHSAFDAYLAGKGESINRLLKPEADLLTGHDVAWGARAAIKKV